MIWRHNCRRRLLRVDAPISVTGLAEKLGVWWATAQHRIARLEESGVIVGYTAKVKPEPAARRIRGGMRIQRNQHSAVHAQGPAAGLLGLRLFLVAGGFQQGGQQFVGGVAPQRELNLAGVDHGPDYRSADGHVVDHHYHALIQEVAGGLLQARGCSLIERGAQGEAVALDVQAAFGEIAGGIQTQDVAGDDRLVWRIGHGCGGNQQRGGGGQEKLHQTLRVQSVAHRIMTEAAARGCVDRRLAAATNAAGH
ncbi:Lrp/AsnC family transcriptional regulator [Chromobacterium vaccinii]|nr:Lrp/AsnC family transcriptional regulator [Chromobacterium vaccinii]MBX9355334.1 Lrp/AsnC family transcriptional regulator [Chromobacterium vaccinii]